MTHNGVLIPAELCSSDAATLDDYARKVKAGNAAFCAAYHELDDAARKLGFEGIDDLVDNA